MKEKYIIGLISFILSSISFVLVHSHILLNRIGIFIMTHNPDNNIQERFKILLSSIDMCLFILPALALGLSLLLFTKKSYIFGTFTTITSIFAYLFFIANII